MGEVTELLRGARDLISDEKTWVKGSWHRVVTGLDPSGKPVLVEQFCSVGAVKNVSSRKLTDQFLRWSAVYTAVELLSEYIPISWHLDGSESTAISFNDHPGRTHAEVMDMFDKAIKEADDKGL